MYSNLLLPFSSRNCKPTTWPFWTVFMAIWSWLCHSSASKATVLIMAFAISEVGAATNVFALKNGGHPTIGANQTAFPWLSYKLSCVSHYTHLAKRLPNAFIDDVQLLNWLEGKLRRFTFDTGVEEIMWGSDSCGSKYRYWASSCTRPYSPDDNTLEKIQLTTQTYFRRASRLGCARYRYDGKDKAVSWMSFKRRTFSTHFIQDDRHGAQPGSVRWQAARQQDIYIFKRGDILYLHAVGGLLFKFPLPASLLIVSARIHWYNEGSIGATKQNCSSIHTGKRHLCDHRHCKTTITACVDFEALLMCAKCQASLKAELLPTVTICKSLGSSNFVDRPILRCRKDSKIYSYQVKLIDRNTSSSRGMLNGDISSSKDTLQISEVATSDDERRETNGHIPQQKILEDSCDLNGFTKLACCMSTASGKAWNLRLRAKRDENLSQNIKKDLEKLLRFSDELERAHCGLTHLLVIAALYVMFASMRTPQSLEGKVSRWSIESNISFYFRWQMQDLSRNLFVRRWFQRDTKRIFRRLLPNLFNWMTIALFLIQSAFACTDIRPDLPYCVDYDAEHSVFNMTCSFAWTNSTKCISLLRDERFEGNGHAVNITGVANWEGLFQIASSGEEAPSSLQDAPYVHDVHMIGGETSATGGFFIRPSQKHFIVDHCSSTGVIRGLTDSPTFLGGGGICGQQCSGSILITQCWSSGEVKGYSAGGITGRELGLGGNQADKVTVSHCHSTGKITGQNSGGICGLGAGRNSSGVTVIKKCYSIGEIVGQSSGGIGGSDAAMRNGSVSVMNCHSRGNITGCNHAGGIFGRKTGSYGGTVRLINAYASGQITHQDAGGLIGHIHQDARKVTVTMSVYNGKTGDMVGDNDAKTNSLMAKNSGDLENITGTVYCCDDDNTCWDTKTVWQVVDDDFPILRPAPSPSPEKAPGALFPKQTGTPLPSQYSGVSACMGDIGGKLRNGTILASLDCISYDTSKRIFTVSCSFAWPKVCNYSWIELHKDEVFEGNNHQLCLENFTSWMGLFRIRPSLDAGPSSLEDAPIIRNVHMIGGETSSEGGFIVQAFQKHFIVKHCSSSGVIQGVNNNPDFFGGGGICGHKCSGYIRITYCWSSGEIRGYSAGGIAGRELGIDGERNSTVLILRCYSTGSITGMWSGGICGHRVGQSDHSTIKIEQCYSVGEIRGSSSGGITGGREGGSNAHIFINNSYSRGDITGPHNAGGMCGRLAGDGGGTVTLMDVYASGQIIHPNASGIIGSVSRDATSISIRASVYDGNTGSIIGENNAEPDVVTEVKNSGNLTTITGTVYCYNGDEGKCWDTDSIWHAVHDDFPIFLQSPESSRTATQTPPATPTVTPTMTPSTCKDDIGCKLRNGTSIPGFYCLSYDKLSCMFIMSCSFKWPALCYNTWIEMLKNEIFEGNGHYINLTFINDWDGLVRIAHVINGGPNGLNDAPLIRNVHMIGGETSVKGGFIVQSAQVNFIVKFCSATGAINDGGGGICGSACSGNIWISDCWSSGEISGHAGGIAGEGVGFEGDRNTTVTVFRCHSTGHISGQWSGGICGLGAADADNGVVSVEQCYSSGKIYGSASGGITGCMTARNGGQVSIKNCYSRGSISEAGGICGYKTGCNHGTVTLTNVYASGQTIGDGASGLIGTIQNDAQEVRITMSVYNGTTGGMIGGNHSADIDDKNSGNLTEITGSVYCYQNKGDSRCWDTDTIWQPIQGGFPIFFEPAELSLLPASVSPAPSITFTQITSSTSPANPTSTASQLPSRTLQLTTSPRIVSPALTTTPSFSSVWRSSSTGNKSPVPSSSSFGTISRVAGTFATPSKSNILSSSVTVHVQTSFSPSATASGLPTLTTSTSPSLCCQHGGDSQLKSTRDATDFIVSVCLTGMLFLLAFYVGYRRLRNKRAQAGKAQSSMAELYATQLGVSKTHVKNHSLQGNGGTTTASADGSTSKNPLVHVHRVQNGNYNHDGYPVNCNAVSAASDTKNSTTLPFTFVEMKNIDPCNRSKVRILSSKQPNLRSIENNNFSSNTEAKLHIAQIRELDTSQMTTIDRAIIKLRQWKAKLLAEPPPVVAVSAPENALDANSRRKSLRVVPGGKKVPKTLASQLEYAANRREGDRSMITSEITRYTESRRQGRLQKKEFTAIPPSLGDEEGKQET